MILNRGKGANPKTFQNLLGKFPKSFGNAIIANFPPNFPEFPRNFASGCLFSNNKPAITGSREAGDESRNQHGRHTAKRKNHWDTTGKRPRKPRKILEKDPRKFGEIWRDLKKFGKISAGPVCMGKQSRTEFFKIFSNFLKFFQIF